MNKVEVLQLIAAAKMLWPSWREAPSTQAEASLMGDVWLTVLEDLPADLAYAALTVLAAEGREFVPPVGVVRRQAIMLRARAAGDLPPDAGQAWREVREGIERGVAQITPLHPCVEQTAAAVGWYELRTSTNQDALRAHFVKFYAEAVDRFERDLVLSDRMVQAISEASLRALIEADPGHYLAPGENVRRLPPRE